MILNKHEGSIDTGKMMRGLIALAQTLQIDILTGVGVNGVRCRLCTYTVG